MTFLFRIKRIFLLIALGLSIWLINYTDVSCNPATETQYPTDQRLQYLIKEAKKLYEHKYREAEEKASALFEINFAEYRKEFQSQIDQLNLKISLIEKIHDPEEKKLRMELLEKEYEDSDLLQYMQAYHYIQNEIEKDHLFVGKYLSMLEEVLEAVIQKEPIFRYTFLSNEFQKKEGLILTRVVWQLNINCNVSGSTEPLNLHSVFANKANTPMLIKITPIAFYSLSFLRSILVHELNHAYMFKDPVFSDVKKFSGKATTPARGRFTHYFKSLNPLNPSYQYHLIQEYYSLKAQLMFNEVIEEDVFYRLDESNKNTIKEMLTWVYSQLNKENKDFVKTNPTPPVFRTVRAFYPRNLP